MNNKSLNNGLLAGLIGIILALIFYFVDPRFMIKYGSYVIYLVYIFFMYKAGKETRDEMGGFMTFGKGLSSTWLTFIVASFLVTIFNYVLYNFIDPALLDIVQEQAIEQIDKMSGMIGEEGTEVAIEQIEEQGVDFGFGKVALGWAFGLIIPGIIIALIEAAILKREDKSGV